MNKQTLLYSVLSIFILVILAGGVWLWQDRNSSNNEHPVVDKSLSSYVQGSQSNSNASLQVQEPSFSAPNNQEQLPSPEDFDVYEQYADRESTLYIDIVEGQGEQVQQNDTVAVLYQGWLTDGQLFDQSRTNEEGQIEPFIFQLGRGSVITGWEQGILGMKTGGTRRLIIPAVAGYGTSGQGSIPPNAMLIFDVELLDREPQQGP